MGESVTADLEAPRPGKRIPQDQTGSVVDGFKGLGVELVDVLSLAPRLRGAAVSRSPSSRVLAKDAVQPAARNELRVLGLAHNISFLVFIDHLTQE
jgi:hypothetical protein